MFDITSPGGQLNTASIALVTAPARIHAIRGRVAQHRLCMHAAFATSTLFGGPRYHAQVGSRPFTGQGGSGPLLHGVISVSLAVLTADRAVTVRRGSERCAARRHRPVEDLEYVSVTGVSSN